MKACMHASSWNFKFIYQFTSLFIHLYLDVDRVDQETLYCHASEIYLASMTSEYWNKSAQNQSLVFEELRLKFLGPRSTWLPPQGSAGRGRLIRLNDLEAKNAHQSHSPHNNRYNLPCCTTNIKSIRYSIGKPNFIVGIVGLYDSRIF